jgi:hypothetical protein
MCPYLDTILPLGQDHSARTVEVERAKTHPPKPSHFQDCENMS